MHRISTQDRVVITGIGLVASVGSGREAVWSAVRHGRSGVGRIRGVPGIPDGMLLAAMVDVNDSGDASGGPLPRIKNIPLSLQAATEAIEDARLDMAVVDRERFGCNISGHMGDSNFVVEQLGRDDLLPGGRLAWVKQWFPHVSCTTVAHRFGLLGPSTSHSTACASSTIDFLAGYKSILRGRCDLALTGGSEIIHPLFAAGFHNMRALAEHDDPQQASRPFDANRNGFVMGEGASMMVLERLDHAVRRGAAIYAEVLGGHALADAQHLTGLVDDSSDALVRLMRESLRRARITSSDIGYVNAHGTGTLQNDVMETRGIRGALGAAADRVCVSSVKSMLGHLVNASGSIEIATTALALRDGFVPPTINLTDPDPHCDLDCIPLRGREFGRDHALKLSIAFGGHMAAVVLRRWQAANAQADVRRAA